VPLAILYSPRDEPDSPYSTFFPLGTIQCSIARGREFCGVAKNITAQRKAMQIPPRQGQLIGLIQVNGGQFQRGAPPLTDLQSNIDSPKFFG
jgi:hypothetical protein